MPKKGAKDSGSPTRSRSKSADRQSPSRKTNERSGRSRSRSQSHGRSASRSRSSSRSRKESNKGEVLKETKKKSTQEKTSPQTKAKEEPKEKKKAEKKTVSKEKTKKQGESEEEQEEESSKKEKVEKRTSIGRQSTPPRPRAARDLESPTRSSLRIREKQITEITSSKNKENVMKTDKEKAVPRTKEHAFGGPIGATILILSLPLATYLLNFVLEVDGRCLFKPGTWFKDLQLSNCFDQKSALVFLAWFLFQTVIAIIPFGGKKSQGLPLRGSGKRLTYNCNGFFALVLSLAIFSGFALWDIKYRHGKLEWFTYVVNHYFPFMMFALIFSILVSLLVYSKSMAAPTHALAPDGNSGVFVYDFFMGRELNPRISSFDLKFFCEFRPGLIGWVFLDMAFCVKFWQLYGQWNPAMILVTVFHLLYVGDALFHEEAILSTMDITHEGFGFMLIFGDLVWVPFTYTLTTRYLLLRGVESTPMIALVGASLLCMVGYWIFRASNSQKDLFRRDPKHPAVAGLATIGTSSGRRLLAGGWWGLVRHPNYLGDIIMSVAWSVPCGIRSVLPWLYPVYLTGLLVSRELRDERACAKKHGHGWQKYRETVPYRILPRVF